MSDVCPYCGWSEHAGVAHDCRWALTAEIERLRGDLDECRRLLWEACELPAVVSSLTGPKCVHLNAEWLEAAKKAGCEE